MRTMSIFALSVLGVFALFGGIYWIVYQIKERKDNK